MRNRFVEPEKYECRCWPMGIAIEKGFHSLVEVLLQNGIPADARALQEAVSWRSQDIVELLFEYGAEVNSIDFEDVVRTSHREIIHMFIRRGADLITGYPVAQGLIQATRLWLGIYKSCVSKLPELQFQADIALRHFCSQKSLRGVSLLMWLGGDPRTRVPHQRYEDDEDEELWSTALEEAAWRGHLEIIKKLRPDPARDDLNKLLHKTLQFSRDFEVIRFWIDLGADVNHVNRDGASAHRTVLWRITWDLDPRFACFTRPNSTACKDFALEWFGLSAKWDPTSKEDFQSVRQCLALLNCAEAHELIHLWVRKEVISNEKLEQILNTPKLRVHLQDGLPAIAKLIPRVRRWITRNESGQKARPVPAIYRKDRGPKTRD